MSPDTTTATSVKTAGTSLYELADVSKVFTIGTVAVPALRDVSLRLGRGEIVALQGPSGSGKSTLLNLLGLIERPSKGRIAFAGAPVEQLSETALTAIRRRSIGFIFQNFNLMPILSALENVEYPLYLEPESSPLPRPNAETIRQRAEEALALVGLAAFARHKPRELSGGQRQRVAIARAIIKKPEVILADEPTANLDSKTAAQIIELVKGLRDTCQATIILATHDAAVAAKAERHVYLRDGHIVSDRT